MFCLFFILYLYIDNKYTGIVEKIQEYYGSILGSQNFDPRILNKYYNDENYKAYKCNYKCKACHQEQADKNIPVDFSLIAQE